MKKRMLSILMALAMILSLLPVTVLAADEEATVVNSRDELYRAMEDTTVSRIELGTNIDMGSEKWAPVTIAADRVLTIDGKGFTISNLTVANYTVPSDGSGVAGTGSSCDYYSGFVGNNSGNLTIENIKFFKAEIDVAPLTENSTGSSILAVVCANNNGNLEYNNVTVDNCIVRGYTKVGILHGFSQDGGKFTANQCTVTNCEVVLEADGTDKEACFSGILVGYDGNNATKTNGIRLSGNKCTIDSSVNWGTYEIKTAETGVKYVTAYGNDWGLTCDTYARGSAGVAAVTFVAEVNGYQYETLADAIAAAPNGEVVKLLKDTSDTTFTVSEGVQLTLDLGGHELTMTGNTAVSDQAYAKGTAASLINRGTLTIQNGTIQGKTANTIINLGSLTLASNMNLITADLAGCAVINLGGSVTTSANVTNNVGDGIVTYGGTLNVAGGTISAENDGMSPIVVFNRAYDNNSAGATVNVEAGTLKANTYAISTNNQRSGGSDPSNVTITGGILTSSRSAIYWPSAGTLTIGTDDGNGPDIISTNGSAIEVCSGTLVIKGGNFVGQGNTGITENWLVEGYRSNSGAGSAGDAITIIACRGTGYNSAPLNIMISGGTFSAKTEYAVRYMNCNQANSAAQIEQDVNVSITGGDFAGALQDVDASFVADNDKKFISGGTFAQDLSESGYLADAVKYEVGHPGGTFTYAKTLADAQSAAKPGDTITDLKATADNSAILTLNYNDDGTTTDSVYTVAKNTNVTLPQPTRDGYVFLGWYDADGNKVESPYTVSKTETLTAQWSVISSGTSYAITVSKADNGTVTASRTRGTKGLTVTLTVKADEGYKLDTITVTDKNGNEIKLTDKGDGKYTFTMPASAVTVKASFAKDDTPVETGLPFTDVKADDWFYEAVKYAYDNKLMDGTSSTTFAPLMTTNRAMIVTILWRLEGSPVVNYAMNFSDVESGVWYTEAVRWAAAEGIVKGYSDTVFAPDDTVTREQLATILYRYAGYKEYDVSAKGDLTTFADGSTVSTWAADGMTWAAGAQLITGKDGGKLDPTGTATRAEVATILMRFCENVAK